MKGRPFLFPGCMVLCAVLLVVCTGETVVPAHLVGVWKTSEPKFAGCRIEFSEGGLILGLADGKEAWCRIERIESVEESGRRVEYTIRYRDEEGQKSELRFLYDPHSGGTLQLKNHSEIWARSR